MAEVTRVPLQPVSRNSLIMLFLGIIIGAALAGGVAWWMARPATVDVEEVRAGTGANPTKDDVVFVKYIGKLADGTEFDRSPENQWPIPGIMPEGVPMQLDGVLPGFKEALLQMQKGGKYTVTIPAALAYGATPPPGSPIPPNADLTFEMELVDFMPLADAEAKVQQLQMAMMKQQQERGGAAPAPGGAPVPAPVPAPAPAQ
jgi:FKBP-type peptidyl-prolyl cis-trans isomerase FkpA